MFDAVGVLLLLFPREFELERSMCIVSYRMPLTRHL